MAAVMALVLLPLVLGFTALLSFADAGPAEIITVLTVVALGSGAFYGLMHFVHTLEGPEAKQ